MARPARPISDSANEALLRSASHHFANAGFQAASLNGILADADWAKSSFYHRFHNKEQLHDYVVTTLRNRLACDLALPELGSLTADNFWEQMRHVLTTLVNAGARHPETRDLGRMFHTDTTAPVDLELDRTRATVGSWVQDAFHCAAELGLVRTDLPHSLTFALTQAILATLDRWVLQQDGARTPPPDPIDLIQRILAPAGS